MNLEIKQILLAHSVDLAAKALQMHIKEQGVDVYLLDDGEIPDFKYLIDDLKPQLILVNDEIYERNKSSFDKHFEQSSGIFTGIIRRDHELTRDWSVVIEEPYDPLDLLSVIKSKISVN